MEQGRTPAVPNPWIVMLTSLPNLLTLSRIAAVPVLVGLFYVSGDGWRWIACALFTAAAVTDFFDGYFARQRQEFSRFGKLLDPIADKLLVAATILMLVAFDRMSLWSVPAAVVILCRELLVSGMREFLAETRVGLPVTWLAKWKTGIQMTAIGVLIVGDAGPAWAYLQIVGEVGLWVAAALTMITGYDYLRTGIGLAMRPPKRRSRRSSRNAASRDAQGAD
jgi:cardiolipin synthase